jgi:hypothetical protein
MAPPNDCSDRALKNKHQAVSQGVRRFGKRSILNDMRAFTKAAQRRITASSAVFQHPAKDRRPSETLLLSDGREQYAVSR